MIPNGQITDFSQYGYVRSSTLHRSSVSTFIQLSEYFMQLSECFAVEAKGQLHGRLEELTEQASSGSFSCHNVTVAHL